MTADMRTVFTGPDPARQLTGLEALKGLSVAHPPQALRYDQHVPRKDAPDAAPRLARRAWDHRFRLVLFAVNGMNVFAVGLLIRFSWSGTAIWATCRPTLSRPLFRYS
jgi:hypothetical protein